MTILEKVGIRVSFAAPADIAKMKGLGYTEVLVPVPVPEPEPVEEPVVEEAPVKVKKAKKEV
jgi:hypothetical protein